MLSAVPPRTANTNIAASGTIKIDLSEWVYSRTGNNDACDDQFEHLNGTTDEIDVLTIHPSCLHYLSNMPNLNLRTLIVSGIITPSQEVDLHVFLRTNLTLSKVDLGAGNKAKNGMDKYTHTIIAGLAERKIRLEPTMILIRLLLQADQRSIAFSSHLNSLDKLLRSMNEKDRFFILESKIFRVLLNELDAVKNNPALTARNNINRFLQWVQPQPPKTAPFTRAPV